MIILNQRDSKWASTKLGFGSGTIGDYGCLVTVFAMMWDSDPLKVNDWFKKNDCFDVNLVKWWNVPGYVARLNQYINSEVLEAIEKYGCCIVETDFDDNPSNGKHFVLAIGNKKCYDPWTGREKLLSNFPEFYGFAVFDPTKNPLKGTMLDDEMVIKKSIFEDLVSKSSKFEEFNKIGYGSAAEVTYDIQERNKSIENLKTDLESEKARAEKARKDFNDLLALVAKTLSTQQEENQVEVALAKVSEQLDELDDLRRNFATLQLESGKEKENLNAEIERLKAMVANKDVLANAKMEEIIAEIIKRLKNILKLGR